MEEGCLVVIFGVLGAVVLVIAIALVGSILFANDNYGETDGVVIEVREKEVVSPTGVTTGGNATVVVMDGWHMFLASIGGLQAAFCIGAWAILALAMVASLAGIGSR